MFFAGRLQDGNLMLAGHGSGHDDSTRKHLETQHWLELVDRYVLYIWSFVTFRLSSDSRPVSANTVMALIVSVQHTVSVNEKLKEKFDEVKVSLSSMHYQIGCRHAQRWSILSSIISDGCKRTQPRTSSNGMAQTLI